MLRRLFLNLGRRHKMLPENLAEIDERARTEFFRQCAVVNGELIDEQEYFYKLKKQEEQAQQ